MNQIMPWGICSSCRDNGPLPPGMDGKCFICANETNKEQSIDEEYLSTVDETHENNTWVDLSGQVAEEFGTLEIEYEEIRARAFIFESLDSNKKATVSFIQRSLPGPRNIPYKTTSAWRQFKTVKQSRYDKDQERSSSLAALYDRMSEIADRLRGHGAYLQRRRYKKRILAGLCIRCPECIYKSGLCKRCYPEQRERQRKAQNKYLKNSKQNGLCPDCPRNNPSAAVASGLCAIHYEDTKRRNREHQKKHREACLNAGVCYRCSPSSQMPISKARQCSDHYVDSQRRNKGRKSRSKASVSP